MKEVFAEGFGPVADENSRLLVLGSFPSVKSRAVGFYYGNPQNRFWKFVCGYFGESVPADPAGKREFALRRGIALWDVALSCRICGSSDASIHDVRIADVPALLRGSRISRILCNGGTAYALFSAHFPAFCGMTVRMPSTSPANPRYSAEAWKREFDGVFGDAK